MDFKLSPVNALRSKALASDKMVMLLTEGEPTDADVSDMASALERFGISAAARRFAVIKSSVNADKYDTIASIPLSASRVVADGALWVEMDISVKLAAGLLEPGDMFLKVDLESGAESDGSTGMLFELLDGFNRFRVNAPVALAAIGDLLALDPSDLHGRGGMLIQHQLVSQAAGDPLTGTLNDGTTPAAGAVIATPAGEATNLIVSIASGGLSDAWNAYVTGSIAIHSFEP